MLCCISIFSINKSICEKNLAIWDICKTNASSLIAQRKCNKYIRLENWDHIPNSRPSNIHGLTIFNSCLSWVNGLWFYQCLYFHILLSVLTYKTSQNITNFILFHSNLFFALQSSLRLVCFYTYLHKINSAKKNVSRNSFLRWNSEKGRSRFCCTQW